MPVHEVVKNGRRVGYQWGQSGKVYPTRAQAERQARAIYSTGYRDSRLTGSFTLPAGHLFGMEVPLNGSACSKCRFVSADGQHCGNRFFQKWMASLPVTKDPSALPAPADRYCCDVFEARAPVRADGTPSARRQAHVLLTPPKRAEVRYKIALRAIIRGVHKGVAEIVEREILGPTVRRDACKNLHEIPQLKGAESSPGGGDDSLALSTVRSDAPGRPADRARRVLTPRLREKVARHISTQVGPYFDEMAKDVDARSRAGMGLIGIPISEATHSVNHRVAKARAQNIALMEDAGRDYVDDVLDVLTDPDAESLRVEDLADHMWSKIQGKSGASESRAELIAVDQTLKLSSAVNQARQVDAGVSSYTWSTSLDERVRPMHADLEGQEFDWDDPPITNSDGDTNAPGGDYRCRCIAVPLIPELEDEDTE